MHRAGFILTGLLGLTACSGRRSSSDWPQASPVGLGPASTAPTPAVIVTPDQGTTGRVASINPTARYVVVSYPIGVPLPPLEQRLNVYRAGLKVAEIKISGPSRDTHTIGDIVTGECQVGDEVRVD